MPDVDRPAVIVVSHICPFPAVHGNCSRIVALLRWLRSKNFHVTYVLQPVQVDSKSGIAVLADMVDALEVVRPPLTMSMRRAAARAAKAWLSDDQLDGLKRVLRRDRRSEATVSGRWGTEDVTGRWHIDRWCWPGTREAVRRLAATVNPVAVIIEYTMLSKCLEEVPRSTLKIIDTVEVFFRNLERFRIEDLDAPFEGTPESEVEAMERADVLVGIQKNDTQAMRELLPHKRVITVGHTCAQDGHRLRNPVNGVVLYVGSSNPYNVHGLRQFLVHAWPRIVNAMPDARLRVVGSCPRIAETRSERVVYVGRVTDDELRHEYETAHVVINPQVAGTGLKIKCVAALAAGCAIVVTRAGADGLEEGAGAAFLLATGWEEFARHVLRVLADPELRRSIEAEALRFADRRFSTDAAFSELARVLARTDGQWSGPTS